MATDASRLEWGMMPLSHLSNNHSPPGIRDTQKKQSLFTKAALGFSAGRHKFVCKNDDEESHLSHNGRSPGIEDC